MTAIALEYFQPVGNSVEGNLLEVSDQTASNPILTDVSVFHEMPVDIDAKTTFPDPYQTGYQAGLAKAEQLHADTIKVMENSLSLLTASLVDIRQSIEDSHAKVIGLCLDALLPKLAEQKMREELEGLICDFARAPLEGGVVAYCHPDNSIAREFLKIDGGGLTIKIKDDPSLPPLNLKFKWAGGSAQIDLDTVLSQILSLFSSAPSIQENTL